MRIFICGFGTVGQGFAEVIAKRREFLEDRYGCPVLITGAMDSKTYVIDRDGLDPIALVDRKKVTGRVGEDEYSDSVAVLDQAAYDILVEVSPTDVKTGGAGLRNITHALENGFGAIIAAAGKAAHLAGVLAAYTTLPVIGVPIKTSLMGGLDSLLSMVQMPKGIPVACVAVDGADNAAILAAQMLALSDPELTDRLVRFKADMAVEVAKKDEKIRMEEF